MLQLRPGSERGHAEHGWLSTRHSFSFADYQDPQHLRFGQLRVLNDDTVAAGAGFGAHPHRDMEILTYVLDGALAHRDSMGHGSVTARGEVQLMSAGTGIVHSEFNASQSEPVRFLQIWIFPAQRGLTPRYQQAEVSDADKQGRFALIAGRGEGAVHLNQDVRIWAGQFDSARDGALADWPLPTGRRAYLHLARGQVTVNGQPLREGDALLITDTPRLQFTAAEQAEVLLFDLA